MWRDYVRALYSATTAAPMFGRLLPKEGRFFDLFNAHAEQVVRAAHELKALMDELREARGARAHHRRGRARRRPHHRGDHPPAAHDLHHAARPRPHPPARERDGRHLRPDPGHDRDAHALRHPRDHARDRAARRHRREVLRAREGRGRAARRRGPQVRGDREDLRGDRPPRVRRRPRDALGASRASSARSRTCARSSR